MESVEIIMKPTPVAGMVMEGNTLHSELLPTMALLSLVPGENIPRKEEEVEIFLPIICVVGWFTTIKTENFLGLPVASGCTMELRVPRTARFGAEIIRETGGVVPRSIMSDRAPSMDILPAWFGIQTCRNLALPFFSLLKCWTIYIISPRFNFPEKP